MKSICDNCVLLFTHQCNPERYNKEIKKMYCEKAIYFPTIDCKTCHKLEINFTTGSVCYGLALVKKQREISEIDCSE